MTKNNIVISLLFISLFVDASEREESEIITPLQREERLNLASSKEELDREVEEYFKRFERPHIPMVESSESLDDFI